jgi:uncharacterized membrane protein
MTNALCIFGLVIFIMIGLPIAVVICGALLAAFLDSRRFKK